MEIFDKFLRNVKPIDIGLLKISAMFFGIFLAALIPALANINPGLLLFIVLVFAIKPMYVFFKK